VTPEQAKELGLEMRTGKDKPTLESEYEVTTLQQCISLLVLMYRCIKTSCQKLWPLHLLIFS